LAIVLVMLDLAYFFIRQIQRRSAIRFNET